MEEILSSFFFTLFGLSGIGILYKVVENLWITLWKNC